MRPLKIFAALVLLFAAAITVPADAPATARPDDLISFLNQTILWYRQLAPLQQLVIEPSDSVFLNDNRQIADQVVRLSFDFARSEAQLLAAQKGANPAGAQEAGSPERQALSSRAEQSQAEVTRIETQLESLKQQLNSTSGRKRTVLEANIAETEDELALMKARQDTLQSMLQFASGVSSSSGTKGVSAQIDDLARTVPLAQPGKAPDSSGRETPASAAASATFSPTYSATQATVATAEDKKSEASGLFGLMAEIFEYRRKLRLLETALRLTDGLADSSKGVRSPLVARLRELTQRSDELAKQTPSQDTDALDQQRKELKTLTLQYKQLAGAVLPLGKQTILLDVYKRNLLNWQSVVQGQYSDRAKSLLVRLGILAGVVLIIMASSEIWRRFTFRYVQDSRRRHQFLILRRIIVIPLLLVIIVVAFANGLGSVTLFAGLSTAGLAVALQNLIQAVVGYFVLIGKLGVRVGDRIQVSGVTGDVIDIGMVRLHLVEMSTGPGSRPTGRVVAFSNAVVFQPNAGFFKQIPGTNFVWHEVSLLVSKESDYRLVEEKMLQAVNRIFTDYKEKMELQRRSMERAIHGLAVEPLHPESRLNLASDGTQIVVRYPVEVDDASAIDDRIARAVLDATGREPHVEPSHDESTSTVSEPASTGD